MEFDVGISTALVLGIPYERHIARILKQALEAYASEDPVYLDIGANVGGHLLPLAVAGFKSWAVEPLRSNQVLVGHISLN